MALAPSLVMVAWTHVLGGPVMEGWTYLQGGPSVWGAEEFATEYCTIHLYSLHSRPLGSQPPGLSRETLGSEADPR